MSNAISFAFIFEVWRWFKILYMMKLQDNGIVNKKVKRLSALKNLQLNCWNKIQTYIFVFILHPGSVWKYLVHLQKTIGMSQLLIHSKSLQKSESYFCLKMIRIILIYSLFYKQHCNPFTLNPVSSNP